MILHNLEDPFDEEEVFFMANLVMTRDVGDEPWHS